MRAIPQGHERGAFLEARWTLQANSGYAVQPRFSSSHIPRAQDTQPSASAVKVERSGSEQYLDDGQAQLRAGRASLIVE